MKILSHSLVVEVPLAPPPARSGAFMADCFQGAAGVGRPTDRCQPGTCRTLQLPISDSAATGADAEAQATGWRPAAHVGVPPTGHGVYIAPQRRTEDAAPQAKVASQMQRAGLQVTVQQDRHARSMPGTSSPPSSLSPASCAQPPLPMALPASLAQPPVTPQGSPKSRLVMPTGSPTPSIYAAPSSCGGWGPPSPGMPRAHVGGVNCPTPSHGTIQRPDGKGARRVSDDGAGSALAPLVLRLRRFGRALLLAVFVHTAVQQVQGWPMGGFPPWPLLVAIAALMGALCGYAMPLAAAALLLVMGATTKATVVWAEIMAAWNQHTANVLPLKELAGAGAIVMLFAHHYHHIPCIAGRSQHTGLMYTRQWAPGRRAASALGHLMMAPLFISMLLLQFSLVNDDALGFEGYQIRLGSSRYWWPAGFTGTTANNWQPLQCLLYIIYATGVSRRVAPAGVAALLILEGLCCWRFWSALWASHMFMMYLRRHFVANLAVAGGLLVSLPMGATEEASLLKPSACGCTSGLDRMAPVNGTGFSASLHTNASAVNRKRK